jgi:serine protease Do
VANQLIERGEVVRGYLGVVIQEMTTDLATSFGLGQARGILVAEVAEGSPAERHGLQQGDVILSYRGSEVVNVGALRNRVAQTEPGTRVKLGILRGGRERSLEVDIGRLSASRVAGGGGGTAAPEGSLGIGVQTLTPDLAELFGIDRRQGVVVTSVEPGSAAARAGIAEGSVVLQVDREQVSTARDFARQVARSADDGRVLLLVRDDRGQRYVVLPYAD